MKTPKTRQAVEAYLVSRPQENAFLRAEFTKALPQVSYSSITRVLASLVRDGVLVRLGYGAYARAGKSAWTQRSVPTAGIDASVKEVLIKMGLDPRPNSATRDYNAKRTTQVPSWLAFDIGRARVGGSWVSGNGPCSMKRLDDNQVRAIQIA